MRRALMLLCAGIVSATYAVNLSLLLKSSMILMSILLLALLILVTSKLRHRLLRTILGLLFFLAGFSWHLAWANARLNERLPCELEGQTLRVSGIVVGLPESSLIAQQFQFEIERTASGFFPRKVILNYYGDQTIVPGQRWQFDVRLNRPHGFSNPGGFDYEAWLFQQGISARGYVRNSSDNRRIDSSSYETRFSPLTQLSLLRYSLKLKLEELLAGASYGGLLIALLLGDRSAISQDNWQLFTATGSNHLFVISGLHIGMISGFVYWCALSAGRYVGVVGHLPIQKFAAAFALIGAFLYALLAGFSLPTQRAFIMVAALLWGLFWNLRLQFSFRILIALLTVLVLNPLAVSGSGIWLSFTAVAALIAFASTSPAPNGLPSTETSYREALLTASRVYVRPQLIVFLALAVPLIFFNQQLSLLAPLVNVVAIPVVGFVIVPLCFVALLIGLLYAPLASFLLACAHAIVSLLLDFMMFMVDLGADTLQLTISQPNYVQLVALIFASLLLLLPRGSARKGLVLPLLFCILPIPDVLRGNNSNGYGLRLHAVDVGQGLAVIIQTDEHALLYDTGAALSADFNIGSAVLVPVLRALKIAALDAVIISHADNDHAGGLTGLEPNFEIRKLLSNRRGLVTNLELKLCREESAWNWDGVEFSFLENGLESPSENNSSCVLMIRSDVGSILLPGDIEREAEAQIALRYGRGLRSTVLVAPHHGSNTSSSYAFLKRVEPEYVIFSAGYRNSFGHPHDRVVGRYQEFSSETFSTFASGMTSIEFRDAGPGQGRIAEISEYRAQNSRYWH